MAQAADPSRREFAGDLLQAIDFRRLAAEIDMPDERAGTRRVTFPRRAGLPARLAFFSKISGLRQHTAIVPHGHANMERLSFEQAIRRYGRRLHH